MNATIINRATAYIKAAVHHDGSSPVVLEPNDSPVLRPFVEGLCVAYVVDEGASYRFVQHRDLDREAIPAEHLHKIGIHNLLGLAGSRDIRVQPYGSIYAVLMGGDFEASLLLLDELWDRHFRKFVAGDYAVAVPARDTLAFCDSMSGSGLAELHQLIDRVFPSGDHTLSDQVHVRRESEWQLY